MISATDTSFEIVSLVKFEKWNGPPTRGHLTKRISLAPDGTLHSDGSQCVMSRGIARRMRFNDFAAFGDHIGRLESSEGIAIGRLRADLPDQVKIETKKSLDALNGTATPDLIARTGEFITYTSGQPSLALLDFDTKGIPQPVWDAIREAGGFRAVLPNVLPALASCGSVARRSTSAGIRNTDTGERLAGSDGVHVYVLVQDGSDIERFLRTLHDRCWLAGLGWMMVGAGGQLLERSIVDRMVGAPERIVFEGTPVLDPPLAQDLEGRRPIVTEGAALDTVVACPPLTIVEKAKLQELRAREAHRLAPDSASAREAFITRKMGEALAVGTSPDAAAHVAARQCAGILLPDAVLPFDDPELAGVTVRDVLANPGRFVGETLADPLEGIEYGTCKAKIMRRADGTPWINSFAHGRTVYELKYDAKSVEAALAAADKDYVVATFVAMALAADLTKDEIETLRNLAAERTGIGRRVLDARLAAARKEQAQQQTNEKRERAAAERQDPRPQVGAPLPDAPWLPQMQVLNDVLGSCRAAEPPMRDIDGVIAQVRVRRVPNMHALTAAAGNDAEPGETRLPPPEQPLLTRLNETQLAELVERHVDYVDEDGRSVHLAAPFVRHFHTRTDDVLPTVAAIATLPIVLPDGTLLAKRGLDRERGIVFRVPAELLPIMPAAEECTPDAVAKAMAFLTDDFLADVATDYTGKCTLIAAAMTVIERTLLPERPAFFVTAGRRGGGKTTTLIMLLVAVTGIRPSAAAWSPSEEERRKALLAYLMEAVPAVVWDNIVRGTQISCPHIEKACTTAFYSDRRLGVSEMIAVAASAIHFFTGNNIGPRGDLASRSLQIRLEVDRADPENREFRHPDPIGWTEANRGEILRALYTILLGNPVLDPAFIATWWRLVGSAVEHAAAQHAKAIAESVAALAIDQPAKPPVAINFRDLFLSQEEDDEEFASLADALAALADTEWRQPDGSPKKRGPFQAIDLVHVLNDQSEYRLDPEKERAATLREFLFPDETASISVSARAVGKRLKRHVGEPVRFSDQKNGKPRTRTLSLTTRHDTHANSTTFEVKEREDG